MLFSSFDATSRQDTRIIMSSLLRVDRHLVVGRALAPSEERSGFEPPIRSSQILANWHLLFPWLAFTI